MGWRYVSLRKVKGRVRRRTKAGRVGTKAVNLVGGR